MRRKISQLTARSYLRRAEAAEKQLREFRHQMRYAVPYGTHIDTISVNPTEWHNVSTARRLNHAAVVVPVDGEFKLKVYAVKP